MDYSKYDTDHLKDMRFGMVHTLKTTQTPEMAIYIKTEMQALGKELSKRLQLTLEFQDEPSDGAFSD